MQPTPEQSQLFTPLSLNASSVLVNDRVSFQTEDDHRVIYVQGVIFAHYWRKDRCAEAYALVKLYESGYADQNDLARCFGYSTRTLRRYQQRLESGGLSTLACPRGRPAGTSVEPAELSARDRTILRLKTQDMSNRWIGARLGLSETAVRKILSRLGWKIPSPATAALFPKTDLPSSPGAVSNSSSRSEMLPPPVSRPPMREVEARRVAKPVTAQSLDLNPLDRSMDRLMAALGLLEDAPPRFAPASNLPRAGVLLAVPVLLATGLLPAAAKIYGSLGPSFYGLRTTMVAYVLLACWPRTSMC